MIVKVGEASFNLLLRCFVLWSDRYELSDLVQDVKWFARIFVRERNDC
jgi:hypothetical protein